MKDAARVAFEKALSTAQVGEWLARGGSAKKRFADGASPLEIACRKVSDGAVRRLLDAGANPTERDALGRTLMHHAVENRTPGIISGLLDLGVPVDSADADGATPLAMAVASFQVETVRLLLEAGASATQVHPKGDTLFHALALHPAKERWGDSCRYLQFGFWQEDAWRGRYSRRKRREEQAALDKLRSIGELYAQTFAIGRMLKQSRLGLAARNAGGRTALELAVLNRNDPALGALLVLASVEEHDLCQGCPLDWISHVAPCLGHVDPSAVPPFSKAKTPVARLFLYLCHHRVDTAALPCEAAKDFSYYDFVHRSEAWWFDHLPSLIERGVSRRLLENPHISESVKDILRLSAI